MQRREIFGSRTGRRNRPNSRAKPCTCSSRHSFSLPRSSDYGSEGSGVPLFPMSASPTSSKRRWFFFAFIAGLFGVGVWYFGFRAKPVPTTGTSWRRGMMGADATPVKTVTTEKKALAVHLKSIGTVTPLNTVTVRSRVDGQLLRVLFEEGQQVKKGDLLAEIDPSPYQNKLAQAEGQQTQNQAQLDSAENDLRRL